ncbi:MAG TPA: hypothetical protein VM555_11610, partial [Tahibacter sp.]|nr:hypothetical protein [Tahibacter sp.]
MKFRNKTLVGAIASVLMLGIATNVAALSPQSQAERQSVRDALTRGVEAPALFDAANGQYRPDGLPSALYAPEYTARAAAPRAMALEYLAARGESLGLDATAVANLAVTSERLTDTIGVVRVQQHAQGLPVYGSDIVVSSASDGRVIFVAIDVVTGLADVDTTPKLDAAQALVVTGGYLGGAPLRQSATTLMLHVANGETHLVWRVKATSSVLGIGGWDILVDAHDGAVLRAQSKTYNVDGTGT